MKYNFLIVVALCLISMHCKPKVKGYEKQSTKDLQMMPLDVYNNLRKDLMELDMVPLKTGNFASNSTDPLAFDQFFQCLATARVDIDPSCTPDGIITFISKEGVIMDAEVYLTTECQGIVFIQDRKWIYVNALHEKGVNFLRGQMVSTEVNFNNEK